jgi:hypothetical protein
MQVGLRALELLADEASQRELDPEPHVAAELPLERSTILGNLELDRFGNAVGELAQPHVKPRSRLAI